MSFVSSYKTGGRKVKKKIAWVLALTMSAQLTVGSVAAFSDMRGHWAEKFIDSLKDEQRE